MEHALKRLCRKAPARLVSKVPQFISHTLSCHTAISLCRAQTCGAHEFARARVPSATEYARGAAVGRLEQTACSFAGVAPVPPSSTGHGVARLRGACRCLANALCGTNTQPAQGLGPPMSPASACACMHACMQLCVHMRLNHDAHPTQHKSNCSPRRSSVTGTHACCMHSSRLATSGVQAARAVRGCAGASAVAFTWPVPAAHVASITPGAHRMGSLPCCTRAPGWSDGEALF